MVSFVFASNTKKRKKFPIKNSYSNELNIFNCVYLTFQVVRQTTTWNWTAIPSTIDEGFNFNTHVAI